MDNKSTTDLGIQLRRKGTPDERVLWQKLRNKQLNGVKFRRQQPIGNYIVDFVSFEKNLIIEIDGGQHNEDWILSQDGMRTAWLNSQGFRVIRFWNSGVLENLESVIQQIQAVLGIEAPSPFRSSPIEGEENGTSVWGGKQ
ncbi:MAG: endonuclease domain-containing protein [Dehalococcoidia bacterium]|nr:endonuclease domain-containing protein [Dehalococcoidia bacterium]